MWVVKPHETFRRSQQHADHCLVARRTLRISGRWGVGAACLIEVVGESLCNMITHRGSHSITHGLFAHKRDKTAQRGGPEHDVVCETG